MKNRQKVRMGIILSPFVLSPALYYYLSPYLVIQASSQTVIHFKQIERSSYFDKLFIERR